jgi:hypothetical protein
MKIEENKVCCFFFSRINKTTSPVQERNYTSQVGIADLKKEISSSLSLKFATKWMHSSKPAKTVYSPPKGFFLKYRSKLKGKNENI